MRFLFHQKVRAEIYTKLFNPAEAKANNLPCLVNRQPSNLILWAKVRFYMQVRRLHMTCGCAARVDLQVVLEHGRCQRAACAQAANKLHKLLEGRANSSCRMPCARSTPTQLRCAGLRSAWLVSSWWLWHWWWSSSSRSSTAP